jgi:integral membrane protein
MRPNNPVTFLRTIALIEAISFLLLVGVAMPLKYLAGMPGAVKVVGWAHGVLFVVFCISLLQTVIVARWSIGRAALVFVSALLPFGPIVIDGRMREYVREFRERFAAGAGAA